jgi:adenosylcobinamide-GDP ribazoletransferase
VKKLAAAWIFYTSIPLPGLIIEPEDFWGMAPWIPVVGLGLGSLLVGINQLLLLFFPDPVRAGLVVGAWIVMTGGLHLDGVADVADGLAVDPHHPHVLTRRLAVMSDSRVGTFAVLALILVILLKWSSLWGNPRWTFLLLTPAWGRWGQLVAIVAYPYLKLEGKGKLLKDSTQWSDLWPVTLLLGAATLGLVVVNGSFLRIGIWTGMILGSALGVGFWFASQLGGHTGDSYGATVEWTESLGLVWATFLSRLDSMNLS